MTAFLTDNSIMYGDFVLGDYNADNDAKMMSMDDKNNDNANLVTPSANGDAPRHCS